MTLRAFIVIATICCITTLTGCASKQAVKIDSGAPTSTSPTTTAPPAVIAEKTDDGLMAGSVIAENIPLAEIATQVNDPRTEINLEPVYFGFDSYLLRADARDTLTRNALWLKENKPVRVIIEGHADERGSDEYNLALAEKRAIAAKQYIETLGVNPDRMETISYGENKPAMAGHDEASWAKNRRVEFVLAK